MVQRRDIFSGVSLFPAGCTCLPPGWLTCENQALSWGCGAGVRTAGDSVLDRSRDSSHHQLYLLLVIFPALTPPCISLILTAASLAVSRTLQQTLTSLRHHSIQKKREHLCSACPAWFTLILPAWVTCLPPLSSHHNQGM